MRWLPRRGRRGVVELPAGGDFSLYTRSKVVRSLASGQEGESDQREEKRPWLRPARACTLAIRDYYRARFAWSRGLNDYYSAAGDTIPRKIRSIAAWGRVRTVDSDRPRLRSLACEGQAYRLALRTSLLSWCRLRDNDPTIVASGARLVALERSGRSNYTAPLRSAPHRAAPGHADRSPLGEPAESAWRNRWDTRWPCLSRLNQRKCEYTRITCANV